MIKRILYIAEMPAYHCSYEIGEFIKSGCEVVVLSAWKNQDIFDNFKVNAPIYFLHTNLLAPLVMKFLPPVYIFLLLFNKTYRHIKRHYKIDLIYTSWSSNVLLNGLFAKMLFKRPWIHRYLMYPMSLDEKKNFFEKIILYMVQKSITKLIAHTNEMKSLLVNQGCGMEKISVHWEKFPISFFSDNRVVYNYVSVKKRASLVFLGNLGGSKQNDVSKIIKSLEDYVTIWVMDSPENRKLLSRCSNVMYFYAKPVGGNLTRYIQGFDGILACYNDKYSSKYRLNTVIPNRVTLGIPAQIPFVIPRNQLSGSKELLASLNLLVEFDLPEEIPKLLINSHQLLRKYSINLADINLNKREVESLLDLSYAK